MAQKSSESTGCFAKLCCCCLCCYNYCCAPIKEKMPLLSKDEEVQELEYHFTQPSSPGGSTPWDSERPSEASEPPIHEDVDETLQSGEGGQYMPDSDSGDSKKSWKLYPSHGEAPQHSSPVWLSKYCCCCCCCCCCCKEPSSSAAPLLSTKDSASPSPRHGYQKEGFSALQVHENGGEEVQEQELVVREAADSPQESVAAGGDEQASSSSFLREKKGPEKSGSLLRTNGARLSWLMVPTDTEQPQQREEESVQVAFADEEVDSDESREIVLKEEEMEGEGLELEQGGLKFDGTYRTTVTVMAYS